MYRPAHMLALIGVNEFGTGAALKCKHAQPHLIAFLSGFPTLQRKQHCNTSCSRLCQEFALLAVGGKIPADLRIAQLNCKNFTVDQAKPL